MKVFRENADRAKLVSALYCLSREGTSGFLEFAYAYEDVFEPEFFKLLDEAQMTLKMLAKATEDMGVT